MTEKPSFTLEHLQDRALACLLSAAIGDGMGAATEQHQIDEIIADFGGMLDRFVPPGIDTFSEDDRAGLVTDDCSQMFVLSNLLIKKQGKLDTEDWIEALLHWSQTAVQSRGMGPTTRLLLTAMAKGEPTDHIGTVARSTRKTTRMGTTNGSAMRVAPAGIINPGNYEAASALAWMSCLPTHDSNLAGAAAAAMACGVAQAVLPGSDVMDVVRACLIGAKLGEELGAKHGRKVAGASVHRRIEIAVQEAAASTSFEDALRRIEAAVGNSVYANESIPAAIGIFAATGGDPFECVVGGTNIGNDADTIAAMAGALGGALHGMAAVPQGLANEVLAANADEDIPRLARGLADLGWSRANG